MNPGLTSFRALAFFAVFLFHVCAFNAGYLGVQAFFVLSGFLLTPILVTMKASLGVREFFINFYGRRALRIFPLYYVYLLVVAVIALIIVHQKNYTGIDRIDRFLNQLPWALSYTYDFYFASQLYVHTHLVSHFWSLAVEEQFYLVWPLLLFVIPQKHLKKVLLLVICAGPMIRFAIAQITMRHLIPIVGNDANLVVYVLPFSHIDAFAIGGFFALYQKSRPGWSTWVVIAAAIALGFVTDSLFTLGNSDVSSLGYVPFMKDAGKYVWGYSVVNFVFAFTLMQVRDRRFLPFLFENRILNYLGKISYGLYVFHLPAIWLVWYLMGGKSPLVIILLSLIVTIAVSALSYEFMEARIIRLKDRFFPKSSADA